MRTLCFYSCLSFCSWGVHASVHAGIHPPGQTPPWVDTPWQTPPWVDIPAGQASPSRWLLLRTVRILLECIIFTSSLSSWLFFLPAAGGLFSSRRGRKESTPAVRNNREVSQSRRTKSDSDCGKTKKGQKFHDYATINYGNFSRNRNHDNDDYYYIEDKLRHFRDHDVINVNFNINTVDSKCACFKHIDAAPPSGYYNPDATEVFPSGELQNSFLTVTDNNYNSLPKTRTRIKTNPWLPSPRETPTPSVTSSMTSSMISSPDDFPADGRCFEPTDEFEYHHGDDLPALNTLNRPTPPIRDNSASAISQSEYNVLQRSFTSDTDNENCSFQPHHNPATRTVHSSAEQISATAMTNPDQTDRFDYEAAFESQIESAKVTRVYGSRDLLDEYGSRDTLFDDVSGSYGVPSLRRRRPFLILRYSRRFEEQESTEETDDTLKGNVFDYSFIETESCWVDQ